MDVIYLSKEHLEQMLRHVTACLPEEGCGMLGGLGSRVTVVRAINNLARSPVRYYMDPVEMVHMFDDLDKNGLELIATFHSHPHGPQVPSETDIQEFLYPGTAVLIWAPDDNGAWKMRAFMITEGAFREIRVVLADPA